MTHYFNLVLVLAFGPFVLKSICCPCSSVVHSGGWPLPSDILTLMEDGTARRRGRLECGSFPLSALGSIVGSGHIPFMALSPSGQAPMAPNANRWLWLLGPSNCTSFPCSVNFLLLLIWLSSLSPCVKHQIEKPRLDKKLENGDRVPHCTRGTEKGVEGVVSRRPCVSSAWCWSSACTD